jgi:hypothetical protein
MDFQDQTARFATESTITPKWTPLNTRLHRYYGPIRHPLAFGPLPGLAGYRAYLAPAISRRGEEGFSSCWACPCHRAVASTPPKWNSRIGQISATHAAFTLTVAGSALGAFHFRGHIYVHFCYGPMTRAFPKEMPVDRLQGLGFPPPCYPSYGLLTLPRQVYPLLNTPALAGRTTVRASFPAYGSREALNITSMPVASSYTQPSPASHHRFVPLPGQGR